MPQVTFQNPDGTEVSLDGELGQSVMSLALQNGVDGIIAECGGSCACATCHVYVDEAYLSVMPEMDELEDDMLEGTACDRTGRSRLSCQILLAESMDGLRVELPRTQI